MTFAWIPSKETIASSNLARLMQELKVASFEEAQAWSARQPEAFWERTVKALGIKLRKPYSKVLDVSAGIPNARWLKDAEINIADSCFKGAKERIAIITHRQNGRTDKITLGELDRLSNRVANGLKAMGLGKGDRVAIDMMMTAEAAAIYFGVIKMGGAVISIPDSFPPEEIAKRLRIGGAKAAFTQDVMPRAGKHLPMYEKLTAANAPVTVVLPSGDNLAVALREGDKEWKQFLSADEAFEVVACAPHDPINILFSSGTTGEPKAIPWDHTTAIKCGSDGFYHHDLKATDISCWPTNIGWMMGPWLLFSGLLNGATVALYEGAPTERGFCEFVHDAKVTMLGLVPSIAKAWRKSDYAQGHDWSSIRTYSSSGEASNADDYRWLMSLNQPAGVTKPIVEYCGGTEVGGGYVTGNLVTPQNPSEFNGKTMGIDFVVMGEDGKPCKVGEMGEVFLVPPSMGLSIRILNADNDTVYYKDSPVWEGKVLRRHGDRIIVKGPHCFQSDGRADNTMNLGGIKVSSAEIERTVAGTPGVIETAAIGVPPIGGGPDRLIIYAVTDGKPNSADIKTHMAKAIKEKLNPLFHVHEVILIPALPRTASNKVMHKDLRVQYRQNEKA